MSLLTSPLRRSAAVCAAALTCAVVLGGCGDNDGASEPAGGENAITTTYERAGNTATVWFTQDEYPAVDIMRRDDDYPPVKLAAYADAACNGLPVLSSEIIPDGENFNYVRGMVVHCDRPAS